MNRYVLRALALFWLVSSPSWALEPVRLRLSASAPLPTVVVPVLPSLPGTAISVAAALSAPKPLTAEEALASAVAAPVLEAAASAQEEQVPSFAAKIAKAWRDAFQAPRARRLGEGPGGSGVYELPAGKRTARVFVDAETLGLAASLTKGASFTVFGSKALEMLSPLASIAKTGRLSRTGDVDLFLPGDDAAAARNDLSGMAVKAFSANPVSVMGSRPMRNYDRFSFGRLQLKFLGLGEGRFALQWEHGRRRVAGAYADWAAGTVRFLGLLPMSFPDACQGMIYFTRYPGMRLAGWTRARVARGLRRFGDFDAFYDHGHSRERFAKIFKHALHPEELPALLREISPRFSYNESGRLPNDRASSDAEPVAPESRDQGVIWGGPR